MTTDRPLLLDLYCGGGGCAKGYATAGFRIVGVDIYDQPNYPYEFVRADALSVLERYGSRFDAIHASPPCQAWTRARSIQKRSHLDWLTPTKERLVASGKPYVIENVEGAPLQSPTLLCGEMFGLGVYRHRLFETNFPVPRHPHPPHRHKTAEMGYGVEGLKMTVAGHFTNLAYAKRCMGIDWMTREELAEAVPPAYTEYIGRHLLSHIRGAK